MSRMSEPRGAMSNGGVLVADHGVRPWCVPKPRLRPARAGIASLVLAALLLACARAGMAQAASVKGYGELTRFGEASSANPTPTGKVSSTGVHLIGVDASENSVFVLDEPKPQEETTVENQQGEFEVTRHFRLQQFSDSGAPLASVSFDETGPGEEIEEYEPEPKRTIEGIAIDQKLKRVYVLAVDLRQSVYQVTDPKKEVLEEFEQDSDAPVASTLYAFETDNKGGLAHAKGTTVKGILDGSKELDAQSTEPGKALLEPAGIAVDPENDDVLILAHEDTKGAKTDNIASNEDHYVVQAITPEGKLSTRWVDSGNVLKQAVSPGSELLKAYPNSPVVTGPEGSEQIVVDYGKGLMVIPASLSSSTPPSYLYKETEAAGVLPVATGASLTQGGGLSVSPEGVIFGMAQIENELKNVEEAEPGVVLRSPSSGAEIGWTGGQSPEFAHSDECVLEPDGDYGYSEEPNAIVAAGSEGKVFVLAPVFLSEEPGAATRAIVEFGPAGSGCPQAKAGRVLAELAGHEVEEGTPIPAHTEVTLASVLTQADSLQSKWSFGDGSEETVSSDQYQKPHTAPHSFERPGEYTVTATISSDDLAEPNQVIFNGSSFLPPTLEATGKVLISGSPSAVSGAAELITKSSATVHGTVNPNSAEVEGCSFEYGAELPSGKTVPCESLPGSGKAPVAVSGQIGGLEVDTSYHYRIVATNRYGTGEGAERTFTTLPTAPTATTEKAADVKQTIATLNATVNPNGGKIEECRFEYGTRLPSDTSTACESLPGSGKTAVAVSAKIGGLEANTTYQFRIIATNEYGSGDGAELTFMTLPPAPTASTGAASQVRQTSATLNAIVNPNGGAVSECELEFGTTESYGHSQPCSPAPGSGSSPVAVSASVTGLIANTTYHFTISAINAGGASKGSDATFTTLPNQPTVVTGSASSLTSSSATLNGTVNPNGGVSSCEIEYGTSPALAGATKVSCGAPGSGSSPVPVYVSVTGLSGDAVYYFRVVATNAGGTSTGGTQSFTTVANPPTVLTEGVSSVTQTSATLEASVNPNGGSVTGCVLEYGASLPSGTSVPCSPSPGSGTGAVSVSGAVGSLAANTSYKYRVVATNAGGTSTGGTQSFTTVANPPTVLTEGVSSVTQTSATLEASVNPNGGSVTGCVLEYGASLPSGTSVPCSPSPGSGTGAVSVSGAVGSLAANTSYKYRVVATNAGGTSTGGTQSFTTAANPPTVLTEGVSSVTQTSATLEASVNPNGGNVTGCVLEYGASLPSGTSVPCSPSPGSGTGAVSVSGAVGSLAANTSYKYRVVATNAGGTSTGGTQSFTTAANPPTVLTEGVSSVTQTSATLEASVNPNGGNVTGCVLEYGASLPSGTSVPCSPSPGSGTGAVSVSGAVGSLAANTSYKYRVVATNAGGTSTGGTQSFTTAANPPTVLTEGVSSVTQTSATLEASVNPNGGSVTGCVLEYGASLPSGTSVPCSPSPGSGTGAVSVSGAVGSLAANTSYKYRVVATNAGGTSTGGTQSFTTVANPPTVLTEGVSSVTQTSATLEASVNPNGGSVTGCVLEYGASLPSGTSVPCSPSPGSGTGAVSVSGAVGSLAANTSYKYRVVATNAGGTSTGGTQSFTTVANPPTVLTEGVSSVTQTSATLEASVNPNGGNVTGCVLEYGGSLPSGTSVPCSPSPGSGTGAVSVSGAVGSLAANTSYKYRVVATNAGGTSTGGTQSFTTVAAVKYGTCVKTAKVDKRYSARYEDKNCTKESARGEGEYEWVPTGEHSHIKTADKLKTITLKSALVSVVCKKGSGEGEITGPTADTETLTYTSCKASTTTCTSAGEPAGSIRTNLLDTVLIAEHGEVRTRYESAVPPYLAEFECGGTDYRVNGSVAAVDSCNVNVMATKDCETFAEGVGEQHLQLEVVGGMNEPAVEITTATSKTATKIEIKTS